MISKKLTDAKIIFQSSEESNRFYFDENNINFLIGDLIIETSKGWFIFEMLTNDKYEYRFSVKNKYFYQVDIETKEKTKRDFTINELISMVEKDLGSVNVVSIYNNIDLFLEMTCYLQIQ